MITGIPSRVVSACPNDRGGPPPAAAASLSLAVSAAAPARARATRPAAGEAAAARAAGGRGPGRRRRAGFRRRTRSQVFAADSALTAYLIRLNKVFCQQLLRRHQVSSRAPAAGAHPGRAGRFLVRFAAKSQLSPSTWASSNYSFMGKVFLPKTKIILVLNSFLLYLAWYLAWCPFFVFEELQNNFLFDLSFTLTRWHNQWRTARIPSSRFIQISQQNHITNLKFLRQPSIRNGRSLTWTFQSKFHIMSLSIIQTHDRCAYL
jgi:hypothetical protein